MKTMLKWETVDPKAVYPAWRYRAVTDDRVYALMPQHDGWWHLLLLRSDGDYVYSVNCHDLSCAQRTAEAFAEAANGTRSFK
jgi:hypothetical protein